MTLAHHIQQMEVRSTSKKFSKTAYDDFSSPYVTDGGSIQ